MTMEMLLAWWNLIYVLPFALAVLYLILYAASGLTFGETDADGGGHGLGHLEVDHDVAIDHDVDVDHDVDLDGDADLDADADADADVDAEADADTGDTQESESGGLRAALSWLGVGRVPLSILLMVLLLAWGAAGFLANQLAGGWFAGADAWRAVLVSLPAAVLIALLTTRIVVRAIVRWLPLDETTARRRHDLLGLAGEAIYDITGRFGMLAVRDDRGELYQVPCRLAAGHADVPKHGKAVLVSYNAKERLYHVIPADAVGPSVRAERQHLSS